MDSIEIILIVLVVVLAVALTAACYISYTSMKTMNANYENFRTMVDSTVKEFNAKADADNRPNISVYTEMANKKCSLVIANDGKRLAENVCVTFDNDIMQGIPAKKLDLSNSRFTIGAGQTVSIFLGMDIQLANSKVPSHVKAHVTYSCGSSQYTSDNEVSIIYNQDNIVVRYKNMAVAGIEQLKDDIVNAAKKL